VKITDVAVHPILVPLRRPCSTAHEFQSSASLILVEVQTDSGLVGFGEVQGGPQKLIADLIGQFGEIVRGMDPLGHVEVWEKLFSLASPRPGGFAGEDGLPRPFPRGQRPQILAAIGGVDIALWDIKGKEAGMPIFRLLGGTRREVFTYATGGYYAEGEPRTACADELGRFIAAGYRAVKLKTCGMSVADEIVRISATREAIGDAMLMLDMNAPYSVNDCIEFTRSVVPFDIFWLEEPLHWYLQPEDFVRLAADTPIPLAHGEREWHRFTIREFLRSGAIRFVQFDSTRHGGFTESLRIAHMAEQMGVLIAPHAAPQYHAHLVSAFGEAAFGVESHGDPGRHPIQHGIYKEGTKVRDGMVYLNDLPGFGTEIDWDYVEKHPA